MPVTKKGAKNVICKQGLIRGVVKAPGVLRVKLITRSYVIYSRSIGLVHQHVSPCPIPGVDKSVQLHSKKYELYENT